MAALLEISANECVVIDLAVEDEPCALIAAVHRLVAGGREIDDRETTKPEAAAMIVEDQIAGVVRTAMRHLIAHARQ